MWLDALLDDEATAIEAGYADAAVGERLLHARVGAELGADIIKTNYTGDPDSFREVVEGCPVPVVVAGGPRMDTEADLMQVVYDSIHAGGKGVAIGRNVFQAEDPAAILGKMAKIVHEGFSVDEVYE